MAPPVVGAYERTYTGRAGCSRAIILTARNTGTARIALGVLAGVHVLGAALTPMIVGSDVNRALVMVAFLAPAALVATVAAFPHADPPRRPG